METYKLLDELKTMGDSYSWEYAKKATEVGVKLADLNIRFSEKGPVADWSKLVSFVERLLAREGFDCYVANLVVSAFCRRGRELAEAEGYEIVNGFFVYDRAHEAYLKWLESKEVIS